MNLRDRLPQKLANEPFPTLLSKANDNVIIDSRFYTMQGTISVSINGKDRCRDLWQKYRPFQLWNRVVSVIVFISTSLYSCSLSTILFYFVSNLYFNIFVMVRVLLLLKINQCSLLSSGLITSVVVDPCNCWLTAGTSNGTLVCWDLRFQLPITDLAHPRGKDPI